MSKLKKIILAPILLLMPLVATSETHTYGVLNSGVMVLEVCELHSNNLDFGVLDFIETNGSVGKTGSLSIKCTKGVSYKLKVSTDGIAADGFRKLKNKNNEDITVNYNLYLKGTNIVFGDGSIGRTIEGQGTGLLNSVSYDAKVYFDQTVTPGFYEDIIVVTVDY